VKGCCSFTGQTLYVSCGVKVRDGKVKVSYLVSYGVAVELLWSCCGVAMFLRFSGLRMVGVARHLVEARPWV
jgi:hypothetical protein